MRPRRVDVNDRLSGNVSKSHMAKFVCEVEQPIDGKVSCLFQNDYRRAVDGPYCSREPTTTQKWQNRNTSAPHPPQQSGKRGTYRVIFHLIPDFSWIGGRLYVLKPWNIRSNDPGDFIAKVDER